jgi:hypothetical protein
MAYERITLDILISEELRDLLTQIEGDSEVAKLLLKKRHRKEDLVDSPVNFISLSSDDKGKISYLTNDRIAKLDVDSYWTSPSRYKSKAGAFISKLFKNVTAKEVEKFANLFKAISNRPNFRFELVSGDKIKEYYHGDSYASEERGSLGASCMKHDSCQRLFDVYTDNKEVSMLAMLNDDDALIGRALLWDFDGHKLMDRIYAKNDEELSFYFKKWATENNYLYKTEQNWYNTLFFENLNVKQQELKLELKLKSVPNSFPYLDTFKFFDIDNGVISNFITPTTSYTLTTTSGEFNDVDSLRFDDISRVFRYRNDSIYLPYREIYTCRDNVFYSKYNDLYIAKGDSMWDTVIEDYVFTGEYANLNKDLVNQYREQLLRERSETVESKEVVIDNTSSILEELIGGEGLPTLNEIRATMARFDYSNQRYNFDFDDYSPELPF